MPNIPSVFSMRHIFVLSLALNISLILRTMHERERGLIRFRSEPQGGQISQRTRLSSTSSSSAAATSRTEPQDGVQRVINLDQGDPTMYEEYWQQVGDETTVVIQGWHHMSYFSDVSNVCWFLEPELGEEIVRVHRLVGNAVTEGRHIIVGTGSSQLFFAALFALSPPDAPEPVSVVSQAPYYSSYPSMTDCLKSGLFKWAGDAQSYQKEGPYIELVTSPNNPDGNVRRSVVNRSEGILVHDLAYYWPHYTPIAALADHELMLFTLSKSTGHAGTRIGWALVKDQEVARRMIKFVELNTIGVSKDSQHRAAKVLRTVSDSCEHAGSWNGVESFFEFSHHLMAERWKLLKEAVNSSRIFSLPEFEPGYCNFLRRVSEPQPAFAWLKCEGDIDDCESFLKSHRILARGGKHFGVSPKYVRVSMVDREENFYLFMKRLPMIELQPLRSRL